MSQEISCREVHGVVTVRVGAGAQLQDMKAAVDAVQPFDRRLWVVPHLTASREDMQNLAAYLAAQPNKARRVAIVAAPDLAFGLARMFEVFRAEDGVPTRTFRTEDEALAWLRRDACRSKNDASGE